MENWKPTTEFGGWYEVSDQGRVRRLLGKIRALRAKREGYLYVNLSVNGRTYTRYVHRLVALAFVPNPENKPEVNHKNGLKSDNRSENLEWATISEQAVHAFKKGLRVSSKGSEQGMSKLKESDIPEIFALHRLGLSQSEIAQNFGVSRSLIGWVLQRKGWRHVAV
jgi:hypothetical protein